MDLIADLYRPHRLTRLSAERLEQEIANAEFTLETIAIHQQNHQQRLAILKTSYFEVLTGQHMGIAFTVHGKRFVASSLKTVQLVKCSNTRHFDAPNLVKFLRKKVKSPFSKNMDKLIRRLKA